MHRDHEDTVGALRSAVCLSPAVPVFRCSMQKIVTGASKICQSILQKTESQGRLSIGNVIEAMNLGP